MKAPDDVKRLVERFGENIDVYKSGKYNETQVRQEFLNPFWKSLGWDMDNSEGRPERIKDVIHEYSMKMDESTKAPDYCFRSWGKRKFFLEAKKPSVDIKGSIHPAYQLRRYAWSAKLPVSLLSDFEETALYDCRIAPKHTDTAVIARMNYMTYDEYVDRWDELYELFSRERVYEGALERFASDETQKKGVTGVDDSFLREIEGWRDVLARTIAVRNPGLSNRELNFAVQRTIDRIIFLRICEDRGIEPYGRLQAAAKTDNVYTGLMELFHGADAKYNSGIFHFTREKSECEPHDDLTPKIAIDDKPLKDIITHLYYPASPFEFSVLPADILGQVYEQFLGKVIRLTPAHRAVVEEKPEVKKAGGVYYTPTFVVEYIVKHTVGALLESTTLDEILKRPPRALDISCGSGSFLIVVYQTFLDWYLERYTEKNPEKYAKGKNAVLAQSGDGWKLSTQERKRILVTHVFGVDIDSQAVEVTKLSLLLKVLEDETSDSINSQLSMFHERVLPDLANNIKCGNSLIGTDFYKDTQLTMLTDDDHLKINVFDWEKEFPFKFDTIVGNPPYVRIQTLTEWSPIEVEHYKTAYKSAGKGNYDIYAVFVERGLSLLSDNGLLGFILPHKFFNAQYGEPLRTIIANGRHLAEVVHFGDQQVFSSASTYTCLMFLAKKPQIDFPFVQAHDLKAWRQGEPQPEGRIETDNVTEKEWNFSVGQGAELFNRLRGIPLRLEHVTNRIFQGIKTSADKIYIVEERERKKGRVLVYSPEKDAEFWMEPDLLHPLVKGGDSKAYSLTRTDRLILFPYASQGGEATKLIPEDDFKSRYPLSWEYLKANKSYLENRENGKMRGPSWYAYGRSQALEVMPLPKIFTPDIAPRAAFSLDPTGEVFFTGGAAGGYGILVSSEYSREYVLGLLNSRLLDWLIKQTATQFRGGWYSFEARFIRNLPIRTIDFNDPADKARHDNMVALVEQMLTLNTKLAAVNLGHEKTAIQRQIDAADTQIDALVYELYGLTEEEIAVIEGK